MANGGREAFEKDFRKSEAHDRLRRMKKFLETRLKNWQRLEELTQRVAKYRLRNLRGEEVREFGRLYRRTAADLAIAREEVRDRRLINYLNYLVSRAHGAIYRSESSGFGVIGDFFRFELPAVFRRTFSYTLVAFLLFLLPGIFAFTVVFLDEGYARRVAPALAYRVENRINWTQSLNDSNELGATSILTNNIQVTFYAFGGGLLVGIGTVLAMAFNGWLFGLVMGLCVKERFWEIPTFVAAHGVIELTAIFIAGGAGLMIGKALLMPGDRRRIDALVVNGGEAVKLILGCIPMLIVAGFIEGFLSPSGVSPFYKFSVSAASGLFLIAYFLKADRRVERSGTN